MITATNIAKVINATNPAGKPEIELHTVRYRLSVLRRKGKIKATLFGTIYVYPPKALALVKKFNGRLKS